MPEPTADRKALGVCNRCRRPLYRAKWAAIGLGPDCFATVAKAAGFTRPTRHKRSPAEPPDPRQITLFELLEEHPDHDQPEPSQPV